MGKKSKRREPSKKKGPSPRSALNFPVPPRSNDAIIGHIGRGAAATKKVIQELRHALDYEKSTPRYLDWIEQADGVNDVMTYETIGMLNLGSKLVFGRDCPFQLQQADIPACSKSVVLSDPSMGEKDSKANFEGGSILGMKFENGSDKVKKFGVCYFLGECRLVEKDLWDFAVQFRSDQGRFEWPGYWAALQCPFCAQLATPPDEKNKNDDTTYMMVFQTLTQICEVGVSFRDTPRLCCKTCFLDNLCNPYGWEFGEYPAFLRKGIMGPSPAHSAYSLSMYYELSGLHGAVNKHHATTVSGEEFGEARPAQLKISKSQTKSNRGQYVIKVKTVDRQSCAWCGVSGTGLFPCGKCGLIDYCGEACAKRHWKAGHRKKCGKVSEGKSEPQPNLGLVRRKDHGNDSKETTLCKWCQKYDMDEGAPSMCVSCGQFLACGPCSISDKLGAKNGRPVVPFFVCDTCCAPDSFDKVKPPGRMLRNLLDEKFEGPHVLHARLMLAQLMLHNFGRDVTGLSQDVEAAKKEFLWLANNLDYAPAQFAMATFHDPTCRENNEFWDGPIYGLEIPTESDAGYSVFPSDSEKAKEYYNRAVEKGFTMALTSVGTMYKNGELFPVDKQKARELLEQAAERGDPRAMCNLGQMKMRADGIPEDMFGGMLLYRQAADMGIYSAMFMLAQFGAQNPLYFEEGRRRLEQLLEEDWEPPHEAHMPMFFSMLDFYGL